MPDATHPPRMLVFADSDDASEKLAELLDAAKRPADDRLAKLERMRAAAADGRVADYLARRSAGRQHPACWRQNARRAWTQVTPTATHAGVDLGYFPRRFSPSTGQYLVGFGRGSMPVLVVCRVAYSGAACDRMARTPGAREIVSTPPITASEDAARQMFRHLHDVPLGSSYGSVCRDFCLFTDDEAFAIVATAVSTDGFASSRQSSIAEAPHVVAHSAGFRVPSTNVHTLHDMSAPDNVCLHSVCMRTGTVRDRLELRGDYVLLSGHAGVAMTGRKLAVLSVRHQIVWLFVIDENGCFLPDGSVGAHIGHGPFAADVSSGQLLLGVKQRIQAFLARRAAAVKDRTQLHAHSAALAALAMCRLQFLDSETLLIRLGCPEAVMARDRDDLDSATLQTAFFVALRLPAAEVLFFERSTSDNMFSDVAFGAHSASSPGDGHCWAPSAANEMHERAAWDRHTDLVAVLRGNSPGAPGSTDDDNVPMRAMAARRALQCIPMAQTTTSDSPLLDTLLFRYDDRAIGPTERIRAYSDGPVRFHSRNTDRRLFDLDATLPADTPDPVGSVLSAAGGARSRRYTSWIFHPCLPLVISVQHNVVRASHVNVHFKPSL